MTTVAVCPICDIEGCFHIRDAQGRPVRDPETMAETGPQNHPLVRVQFIEGFAFSERIVREARAAAALAALTGPTATIDNMDVSEKPDTLLIVNRLRRKAEVMRLDAPRNSSLWYDLEEMLALVDLIAVQMGGEA